MLEAAATAGADGEPVAPKEAATDASAMHSKSVMDSTALILAAHAAKKDARAKAAKAKAKA